MEKVERENRTCGSCKYGLKRLFYSWPGNTAIECRFFPNPVMKDPDDWCAQYISKILKEEKGG